MPPMKPWHALVVVSICGCAVPDAPEPVAKDVSGCPAWMCGMNSPVIDSFGFHELNLDHLPNAEGFTYERMVQNGTEYELSVSDGIILGKNGAYAIGGANLIGAEIWVGRDHGTAYVIKILDVSSTPSWAVLPNGTQPMLQTYVFQWSHTLDGTVLKDWQDLCSNPPANDDTLGLDAHHTVVFEGDRIDAAKKVVKADLDPRWFNIGCAGSTLAKMYLTGHATAARSVGFGTTPEQRQTMLKMLSADYCGDGTPFTVAGEPLQWADDQGWMEVAADLRPYLEARWDKNGATCLMKPRVEVNPTKLATETFPDVMSAIQDHCGLPPECQDTTLIPGTSHLISGNPSL